MKKSILAASLTVTVSLALTSASAGDYRAEAACDLLYRALPSTLYYYREGYTRDYAKRAIQVAHEEMKEEGEVLWGATGYTLILEMREIAVDAVYEVKPQNRAQERELAAILYYKCMSSME